MKHFRLPILCLLFAYCFFGYLFAQKSPHALHTEHLGESFSYCGDVVAGPPLTPQQARIQDRWNNPIFPPGNGQQNRSGPGNQHTPQALAPIDCANGFVLTFEDIESGTGTGFDDPTLSPCGTGMTLGQERVSTACAVFDYIASVIDMGTVSTDIYFPISELDGTGPLASASPLFNVGILPGTYTSGFLRDHIVNGTDPDLSIHDAQIKFDFGTRYIAGEAYEIFPCTSCPDGALDMYSIMLHEATHALGFFSLIDSDGTSKYSGLAAGPFSRMDDHMLNGAAGGLLTGGGAFAGPLVDITANVLEYLGPGNTQPEPIYSPTIWRPGSSLSHFDNDRSTFTYVMHPSTGGGDNRLWTMPEIEVLIDLGYTLKSEVYTGTPAPNRYVIGMDDSGYLTTPGDEICIPALDNDTDPDGDPISYGECGSGCTDTPAELTILLGSGTAVLSGDEVCFTPEVWYAGPVIIKYCPTDGKYDPDLVNTDNCTLIYLDVEGPCPGDPCNLVCNGGFENHSDNCVVSIGFSTLADCPNTFMANFCPTQASPNVLSKDCPGFSTPANAFGIPNSNFAGPSPNPGTDTYDPSDPDNRTFLGMYENVSTPYVEGFAMQLTEPLEMGKTYEISCKMSCKMQYPTTPLPGQMIIGFTQTAPPQGPGNANTPLDWYASSDSPLPASVGVPSNNRTDPGVWYSYSFTITPGIANLEYIVFEASTFAPGTHTRYIFLDEVRVESKEPEILIQKTVNNPNPSPGDLITYSIIVTNMDPTNPATDLNLHDLLPDGVTYVSSTLNLPETDHNIPLLGPMSSIMVTITATVDLDAPVGVPITNCAYLTSGNNCLNYEGQNCADILIKATDLVITKNVTSGPGPYMPGDMVTFEIVIENAGSMAATSIWLQDILPPEMTYVSHTVTGPSLYAHPNLSTLFIPAGDQVTLTLNVLLNSLATCGVYTNCANLMYLAEVDLAISNNSDCADVEVNPVGGAPTAYPVHPVGTDVERAHGVYKPELGLYVTGDLTNSIDFGAGPMTTAGNQDAYVVKYGKCGIDWQHSEGGPAQDNGVAITAHPTNERIYACGNAGSPFNYQGVNLPAAGSYVVELNPLNGLGIWGRVIPNTTVEDIAVDPVSGNVAVVGAMQGPFTFNSIPYTPVGGSDIYVAVYDANGTELWADNYGSSANDIGKGLAFHPSGQLYITGSVGSIPTSFFGSTAPAFGGGASDGFVGRYTAGGTRLDGSYFASTGDDIANDIAISGGQLYVAGNNGGTMIVGGGPTITSFGGQDAFAARLSAGFTGIWAHDWGGFAPNDYAVSIDVQGSMVLVAGGFRGVASFPGFPNPTLTSMGAIDIFMASMDAGSGVPVNNIQSENFNHWSYCYDIMGDAAGNGYLAGDFFATTKLGLSTITCPDSAPDAYVARGDGNALGVFYKLENIDPVVEAEANAQELEVFPNPSTGALTIRRRTGQDGEVRLTLIDLHGKTELLQAAAPFSAGELQLDLGKRSAGIYFLRMEFEGRSQTEKILLMRD